MKSKHIKRLLSIVLTLALVLTGGFASNLFSGTTAEAASTTVKLNKSELNLLLNAKKTLKVKTTKVKKVKSTTWSSSDKTVATVTKKGVVTAKAVGTATIKCKVKYIPKGSKKTKTKTLKCTVTTTDQITEAISESDITLRVSYDDTSNVGADGKDNGSVRADLSAQEVAQNEMGIGINLGNTMEATVDISLKSTTTVTGFETAWGNPVTTEALIDEMHSYGINTLRIPVAWSNADNDDGTYTLDEDYLARVEEIANYALENGMYVVINDHWDNQWWGGFGAAKYVYDEDGNRSKVADEEMRAKAWARYEAYWTQIAEYFKDYSDHLIFESANEELGSRLNDTIYSNGYATTDDENDTAISGCLTKNEMYETTNAINQKFVDIIRASGGNNTYRFLVIAGYNTNIQDTADERFEMPTDSANTVNKLFLSVHYYTPWDFCGDGESGDYTVSDQEAHATYFSDLQRFTDAGYAVLLGEMSVCNPTGVSGSVSQWFYDVFEQSAQYYAVPCIWDTGAYFSRNTSKLKFKDMAVLLNTVTGSNGDTSMTKMTGVTNVTAVETLTDVSTLSASWSWTGKWYKNDGSNTVGDDKFEEGGGTTVTTSMSSTEIEAAFIPESVTNAATGDNTSISFNNWGYQAFLYIDMSKYTNPAISITFLDGTNTEDNVGGMQLGAAASQSALESESTIKYSDDFVNNAVALTQVTSLSADKPYLYLTFDNAPIVTGIYIYELDD